MNRRPLFPVVSVLVMCGFVAIIGGALYSDYADEQTRQCTITDKDRTTVRNGRSDMRVYTEQCGTLQVGDLMMRGQFDSADIYARLEPGTTYTITTVGWRIPFMSTFPTILGTPTETTK